MRLDKWMSALLLSWLLLMGCRVSAQTITLDLNADDIAQGDGTAVTSWANSGITFAQATGSAQPTYKTSIVNGHNVVRFATSKTLLGPISDSGPLDAINTQSVGYTVFVVFQMSSLTNYQAFLTKGSNLNSTSTLIAELLGGMADMPSNVFGAQAPVAINTWHILTETATPASGGNCTYSVYMDGELLNRVLVAARTVDTTQAWSIGAAAGGTNSFLNGDIARLKLYTGTMTDAQVKTQAQALGTTYNITLPTYQTNINIVCVGTSLVQGTMLVQGNPAYSYHLQNYLGNKYKVTNLGLGGSYISYLSSIASLTDALIIPGSTNILVVDSGTNDLSGAAAGAGATALAAITTYVDARHTAGWNKILIVPIIPRAAPTGGAQSSVFETNRATYNAGLPALVTNGHVDAEANFLLNPAFGTVNDTSGGYDNWTFATGQSENGVTYGFMTVDGVHMSRIGNRMAAVELAGAMFSQGWLTLNAVLPTAGQVLAGTSFGTTGSLTTGTLTVPSVGSVVTGTQYGAGGTQYTGTYTNSGTYPTIAQVLSGVTFGPTNNLTGTVVLPTAQQVLAGATFGAAGGVTGTLSLPTINNVILGVHYGAGGTQYTGSASPSSGITVTVTRQNPTTTLVTWTAVSGNTGGYDITRVLSSNHSQITFVAHVAAGTTTYTDTMRPSTGDYIYRVAPQFVLLLGLTGFGRRRKWRAVQTKQYKMDA